MLLLHHIYINCNVQLKHDDDDVDLYIIDNPSSGILCSTFSLPLVHM